jgi:hypothetical protein
MRSLYWIYQCMTTSKHEFSSTFSLTLIRAALKKSIEWWLQVQIPFSTEINLTPSRPEWPCKEYEPPGRSMLPVGRIFLYPLMKEKL